NGRNDCDVERNFSWIFQLDYVPEHLYTRHRETWTFDGRRIRADDYGHRWRWDYCCDSGGHCGSHRNPSCIYIDGDLLSVHCLLRVSRVATGDSRINIEKTSG